MKKLPYLIQRGTFKDISTSKITGIDSLVGFDYMGSSEFEFGTLNRTLRYACSLELEIYSPDIKAKDGQSLHIICERGSYQECLEFVNKLVAGSVRLKERSDLHEVVYGSPWGSKPSVNFWWAVDNGWNKSSEYLHFFACLGIRNAKDILVAIKESKARKGY